MTTCMCAVLFSPRDVLDEILNFVGSVSKGFPTYHLIVTWTVGLWHPFLVVLGQAYRGFTSRFVLLRIFSVDISVSPHVCFILYLILIY